MRIQPGNTRFATFFDLLTGYRAAELLRVAGRNGLFDAVGEEGCPAAELPERIGWSADYGRRVVTALVALGLLIRHEETIYLSQFSRKFLWSPSEHQQLASLTFEERLASRWGELEEILKSGQRTVREKSSDDYAQSLTRFLQAMDEAAKERSQELWDCFAPPEQGTICEVGAGSGAYLAEFLERHAGWQGIFVDLDDVVARAKADPRMQALGERVRYIKTNLLEESDELREWAGSADLLLLSNLIHCQGEAETQGMLARLLPLLRDSGLLLIHDFFAGANARADLYDLHMLLNTYNGRIYSAAEAAAMVKGAGWTFTASVDLPSYSTAFFAGKHRKVLPDLGGLSTLKIQARDLRFSDVRAIDAVQVPVREWVREKCRFGCDHYGKRAACPPHSRTPKDMEAFLAEYHRGLVLVGEPPLKEAHERLLQLEQVAFQAGFQQAFVFSAGPCPVCESCSPDACRFPHKRRPALEACGVDVYELSRLAGIDLQPPSAENQHIQYVSLLLVD